ncbi:DDE-domain-containing protein [Tricholoma matsutake]|nr:DDE-domain-containing protein [Tricholoma matsutake 945]
MTDGIRVMGEVLRQKWHKFTDLENILQGERLTLSEGWLTAFKRRCSLKENRTHSKAGSVDPAKVEIEHERIHKLIQKYGYRLKDIFNMDETGLFYTMPPDRGLMDKPSSGLKGNKKRLTYAFTANADGSEKLPAFVIGKAAHPCAFNKKTGKQLRFYYRNNAKAWMTSMLYQEFLRDWDSKLRVQGWHILLFQDNFSGHIVPDGLTNISVENFEPNLTSHVQPNDASIIHCFKAHYCSKFITRAIDRYDNKVGPSKIYDIDQLEAMRLEDLAWNQVDMTTIWNCWRKSGILPDNTNALETLPPPSIPITSLLSSPAPQDPTTCAENNIADSLAELEKRGVLPKANRMDIDKLLNPEPEHEIIAMNVSDEEIFESVHEHQQGEEMMEINGGGQYQLEIIDMSH